jgi:hypothetical protein
MALVRKMYIMLKYPGALTKRTVITHRYPKLDYITAVPIACETLAQLDVRIISHENLGCRAEWHLTEIRVKEIFCKYASRRPLLGPCHPPLSAVYQQLPHTCKNVITFVTKQGRISAAGGGGGGCWHTLAESRVRNMSNRCDFAVWQSQLLQQTRHVPECLRGLDSPLTLPSTLMESHFIRQR